MKKIFTLIILAIAVVTAAQAQTITINKTDGTKVTYDASEVSSIDFAPKNDTTTIHSFTGYLIVSSAYFQNMYYGDKAQMSVLAVGDKYLCRFDDATWGHGLFNITLDKGTISGTGSVTMVNPQGGASTTHEATMSGTMTHITISIPDLMGGTTISWNYGDPRAYKTAGTYSAKDNIVVGGVADYSYSTNDNVDYTVVAVNDSTINLVVPEESFDNLAMMGNLVMGTYTISNIAWDAAENAYVRSYGSDGITFDCTIAGKKGHYEFTNSDCKVVVRPNADGTLTVDNTYYPGRMPMSIVSTFTGTRKNAAH